MLFLAFCCCWFGILYYFLAFWGDLVFWLMSTLAAKQVPAAKGVCVCMSPCRVAAQVSGLAKSRLCCFANLFLSPFS